MHNITGLLSNSLMAKLGFLSNQTAKSFQKVSFRPVITLSREPGSGGRPIAELVAKELKYELYDEKFVEDIAKSAKRRAEFIKSIDEKTRSMITDVLQSVLNPDYVSDMTYIRHAAKVVLTKAHQGKVVFLDRGTNFMVPSQHALRVRIQAPYSIRVTRAVKYEGVDKDMAKEIIRQVDLERKNFVRQYFGRNISNANYYDLVLNTTSMTLDDARDIIILAFRRKFRLQ